MYTGHNYMLHVILLPVIYDCIILLVRVVKGTTDYEYLYKWRTPRWLVVLQVLQLKSKLELQIKNLIY